MKRRMVWSLFLLFFLILFSAGAARAVMINTNIPGITSQTGNNGVCNFVFAFYNYALMISGVLAFAAITYGGIKYTLAGGNPSGQSEGKEWVKGAVLGLLLLIGAYLILNVVNPDLTTCGLPILQSAQTNVLPVNPASLPCGGSCGAGQTCSQTNPSAAGGQAYSCVYGTNGMPGCGADPAQTQNGLCSIATQVCTYDPATGQRSCQNTVSGSTACSNSNPTGSCPNPTTTSCQLVNGNHTCVSTTSTRPPACRGYPIGSCVWAINSGVSGCSGTIYSDPSCNSSVPPGPSGCFTHYQC